jgi:putative FmdB family regulatory protein
MPTYEYICAKCGHEFEKVQSIVDKPLTVCPAKLCARKKWGRGRVTRKIGVGGGLIFKGSGFYVTDYRSDKYKEAARKDAGASKPSGAEAKSAPAGDGKPAAKTESKPAGAHPKH